MHGWRRIELQPGWRCVYEAAAVAAQKGFSADFLARDHCAVIQGDAEAGVGLMQALELLPHMTNAAWKMQLAGAVDWTPA